MKKIFSLLILFLAGGTLMYSWGQDKPVREVIPDAAFQQALLAQELANYGYENQDAFSLLAAADILINTPVGKLITEGKISTGGVPGKAKDESVTADLLDPQKLIADAMAFGKNDPHIKALAKKIKTNDKYRGNVDGPAVHKDRIEAEASDNYRIAFKGGEGAEIAVVGDGDTDLDLYVYDESDNLIEKDDDETDRCYVSWTPKWTGSFKIKIINRGSVYNNYTLYTN